jgi:hypothetical protein
MKIILSAMALCPATATASAQIGSSQNSLLSEDTVKVSDYVWAIMGWPNIGIVVGEDELTFVEPDKTLISGDAVQNKVVPNIYGDGGTLSRWIAVLDEVEKLGAAHVMPTHSAVGDGSLAAKEKAFIVDLRARARQTPAALSSESPEPTEPGRGRAVSGFFPEFGHRPGPGQSIAPFPCRLESRKMDG